MKKYLSVFMLYVRGSVYPVLGTISGCFIGQAVLFGMYGLSGTALGHALSRTPFFTTVTCAISLIAAQLSIAFCDRGGKMNNTLQRLRISEKQIFWLQTAVNILMFALYFLAQGLMFMALCFWYDPDISGLGLLVNAYDHPLFHQFFPLDDIFLTITNSIVILGLSVCCAAYSMRQRHNRQSFTTFLMVLATCFYLFLQTEGDHLETGYSILILLVSVYCITLALCGTMSLEVDDND